MKRHWVEQVPRFTNFRGAETPTKTINSLSFPADGTWSVYIHGWQTAGPSADYDMYSWVVSATPGGNMSVDAAPASATIGEFGTVDVS